MSAFEDELPGYNGLAINHLSRSFKNVVNSYKFYWFLAILDHIAENNEAFVSLDELSLRMLSAVWYPLDYFKLSFGKQDSFKDLAVMVSNFVEVDNSVNAPHLLNQIESRLPVEISVRVKRTIKETLRRWVVYRFLTPFFSDEIKQKKDHEANNIIRELTNKANFKGYAPYKIVSNGIVLEDRWIDYFKNHQYILRGFIKWHLVKFLQKNNPNVTGLSEKLEKPRLRDLKVAKHFWSKYLSVGDNFCVYSNFLLPKFGYSLDHFVPWSYVAHDQLWNIIPTTRSVNSAKSDYLPDLKTYLDVFCNLQFKALQFHIDLGNFKLLEDYQLMFKREQVADVTLKEFKNVIGLEVENNIRIAENLGFKSNYIYRL